MGGNIRSLLHAGCHGIGSICVLDSTAIDERRMVSLVISFTCPVGDRVPLCVGHLNTRFDRRRFDSSRQKRGSNQRRFVRRSSCSPEGNRCRQNWDSDTWPTGRRRCCAAEQPFGHRAIGKGCRLGSSLESPSGSGHCSEGERNGN